MVPEPPGAPVDVATVCREACLTAGIRDPSRLDVSEFQAALLAVFSRLRADGAKVPRPTPEWFAKVYERYSSRCGGFANLRCLIDVAEQYVAHNKQKVQKQKSGPSPSEQEAAAPPPGDKSFQSASAPSLEAASCPPPPLAAAQNGSIRFASKVMFPVLHERMAVFEQYDFDAGQLGEGGFGRVSAVRHRATGCLRACKRLGLSSDGDWDFVQQEVECLKRLDHPNIIRLSECYVDGRNVYLISELCQGGPLLAGFVQRGQAGYGGEAAAQACLSQVLGALVYCHSRGIVHRDLKPENILYATAQPDSAVKVIDFGLATFLERLQGEAAGTQRVGTLAFMAPEVVAGTLYTEKVDLWAVGCLLYLLVTGSHPFASRRRTVQELEARISAGTLSNHRNWLAAPLPARRLGEALLSVNPSMRPSASEALRDEWIQSKQLDSAAAVESVPLSIFEGLRDYQASSALRKAVWKLLAKDVDEPRVRELETHFRALDLEADGLLTRGELLHALKRHMGLDNLQASDISQLMPAVSDEERISCRDFVAAMLAQQGLSRAELLNAFRRLDINGAGRVSVGALHALLMTGASTSQRPPLAASDEEFFIDFADFCRLMGM